MTFFEPYNLPFAVALGLMVLLLVVQFIGIGDAVDGDVDLDVEPDADAALSTGLVGGLLSLLGLGRVPLMIWLAVFLFVFAGIGVSGQALADSLTGAPLDRLVAAILAGGTAVPLTALIARPLGALLPSDETTAVSTASLVGRRATITDGVARAASPARAKVRDVHGQSHFVMVEPHEGASELHAGDEVLLVRREEGTFFATAIAERRLSPQ